MLRLDTAAQRIARGGALFLAAACGNVERAPIGATSAPEIASVAPSASASVAVPVGDAAASKKSISRGRGLAEKKDWRGATAAFERAAIEDPRNGVAYSELGFAALLANDVTKSLEASEKALGFIEDPKLRAQILYNLGRAKETKGDLEGARQALEQSLSLRKNDIVAARLSSLGIKPAVPSASDLPCSRTFANTSSLCACVVDEPEGNNAKASCDLRRTPPKFRDGELEIVEVTSEKLSVSLLAANAVGGLRVVARLGRDVEGEDASDTHEVISFEERKLSGRSLAIVRTKQKSSRAARPPSGDAVQVVYNLATYCVLRNDTEETRCVGPFATNISRTVATKADKAADTVELTHKLQGAGVEVKIDRGEAALVPEGMVAIHTLLVAK